MRGCVGWSAPLFFAPPPPPLSMILFRTLVQSGGQDESMHMHSLAIASTAAAGLFKMIKY